MFLARRMMVGTRDGTRRRRQRRVRTEMPQLKALAVLVRATVAEEVVPVRVTLAVPRGPLSNSSSKQAKNLERLLMRLRPLPMERAGTRLQLLRPALDGTAARLQKVPLALEAVVVEFLVGVDAVVVVEVQVGLAEIRLAVVADLDGEDVDHLVAALRQRRLPLALPLRLLLDLELQRAQILPLHRHRRMEAQEEVIARLDRWAEAGNFYLLLLAPVILVLLSTSLTISRCYEILPVPPSRRPPSLSLLRAFFGVYLPLQIHRSESNTPKERFSSAFLS